MTDFDIVIRCGHFLSMQEKNEKVQEDVFLGIEGSKIKKIQGWTDEKNWNAKKFIDASSKIVLPGLINAHGHLPMTLFRGLADDLPFQEWLNDYILPLEARLVNPEFVSLGTELACLEAIRTGVTTVYDMYYFENDIARTVDQSGLRAILGETVFDYPAPDNKSQDGSDYKILDELCERYKNHPRIRPMISPHSPYACSDETLKKARDYAQQKGIPLGVHVSETLHEVKESKKNYSMSPVQRLHELGLGSVESIYAHCVHVDEKDMDLLESDDIAVIHNPESNMKLGAGASPVVDLLKRKIRLGIGSDGAASNNDLNVFREMDVAAKLQKMLHHDNTAMTAIQALRMATREGAKALGFSNVGVLEEGKTADLIVVNPRSPSMQPLHDVCSQLVYACSGYEVEHTICHGKVLMEDAKVLGIDAESLFDRIDRYRERNSF